MLLFSDFFLFFFELRIWLFSSSFQPLYDLLFGALFIARTSLFSS